MKRKRYRYIWCGLCSLDDKVSDFRLIVNGDDMCVRIEIPDDMKLIKYSCDSYSTTYDTRTLRELNAHAVVKEKGKYVVYDELFQWQPHEWHEKIDFIRK